MSTDLYKTYPCLRIMLRISLIYRRRPVVSSVPCSGLEHRLAGHLEQCPTRWSLISVLEISATFCSGNILRVRGNPLESGTSSWARPPVVSSAARSGLERRLAGQLEQCPTRWSLISVLELSPTARGAFNVKNMQNADIRITSIIHLM